LGRSARRYRDHPRHRPEPDRLILSARRRGSPRWRCDRHPAEDPDRDPRPGPTQLLPDFPEQPDRVGPRSPDGSQWTGSPYGVRRLLGATCVGVAIPVDLVGGVGDLLPGRPLSAAPRHCLTESQIPGWARNVLTDGSPAQLHTCATGGAGPSSLRTSRIPI